VAKAIRMVGSAASGILFVGVTEGSAVAGTVVDTIDVLKAVGVGGGVEGGRTVEKTDGMGDIAVPGFSAAGGLTFVVEAPHAVNSINPRDAIAKYIPRLQNCFFM
jgi:hypothetical protein